MRQSGQIIVLMYHIIATDVTRPEWTRTPAELRDDIALLEAEGYFPINLRDLVHGRVDVPYGNSPVVLTFDDSTPGQYWLLPDGALDPDCAVGIMQAAAAEGDWAPRATFFPLLEGEDPQRIVFGQPEWREQKLRDLVAWGYEVGSHTVSHLRLNEIPAEEVRRQLALSKATLEEMIGGGYQVESLATPYGAYPESDDLFEGSYQGISYDYRAVVEVGGGPCPSPLSPEFDPRHIPRVNATGSALRDLVEHFKRHPELRFWA
jgi:peptidoglycan/xylan/chitin deacetylase (PgdA/CDA1 family)